MQNPAAYFINRNQNVAISGMNSFCSSFFSSVSIVVSLPKLDFGLDGMFPNCDWSFPNARIHVHCKDAIQVESVEAVAWSRVFGAAHLIKRSRNVVFFLQFHALMKK
jgi:hypothetical protein